MHILWVKSELLHPLDKGGRIRTYEMLRRLRLWGRPAVIPQRRV